MRHHLIATCFTFLLVVAIAVPSITNVISDDVNICLLNAPEEEENKPSYERFFKEQIADFNMASCYWIVSSTKEVVAVNEPEIQKGFFDIATPPPKLA